MWEPHNKKGFGNYTGQNMVWSLELDIQRGVVSNNVTLVQTSFTKLWSSLVVSPQEGDGVMASAAPRGAAPRSREPFHRLRSTLVAPPGVVAAMQCVRHDVISHNKT